MDRSTRPLGFDGTIANVQTEFIERYLNGADVSSYQRGLIEDLLECSWTTTVSMTSLEERNAVLAGFSQYWNDFATEAL